MTEQNTIFESFEPDLVDRIAVGRREAITKYAKSAVLWGSAPLTLALASTEAFGQDLPATVVDVLNFALTLEYLEAAFYEQGLSSRRLIPSESRDVFRTIGRHENEHVALLKSVLGGSAVAQPAVDFTAGGKYADVFENFATFRLLSETFEDLGVAAYKGQAGRLLGTGKILTVALQIHSVEARHASEVRRIGGKLGWDSAFDKPKTKAQVLAVAQPFLA